MDPRDTQSLSTVRAPCRREAIDEAACASTFGDGVMPATMWTTLADILISGLTTVLGELRIAMALNCITSLAPNHAGRSFSHEPRTEGLFTEDGTIYSTRTLALGGGLAIQPKLDKVYTKGGRFREARAAGTRRARPEVSCWTVCLHTLGCMTPSGRRVREKKTAFGNPNDYRSLPVRTRRHAP